MSADDAESDLLRRAVAGDRGSLSQLLLLHYDGLKRHLAGRIPRDLQQLTRADDILHQTFVRAAQAIGSFQSQPAGSFLAWLKTIAENLIKDAEKRQRRERRAASPAGLPDEHGSWVALVEQLVGDSTSPSGRIQQRESVRCLQVALASLPEDQREVIQRHYLQDQSFEEIGQALGRTKDAIRGTCYRARKNLRALLGRSSLYFSG
ncbi:MAG: sigma-70 family RNA polymerase sigma factor [Planctomycetota bacterium]|nr:sigma-70 family RNA polymerase sigma factor [Planctomycetota bacterium]